MPGSTPIYGLTYQTLDDPPHGPNLGQTLAQDVEAELQRIDAAVAGLTPVVQRRVKAASGTIATTEAVEATLTLAIPASWNTYDLDIWVMVRALETGAAVGNTTISMRVRKTNVSGTILGSTAAVLSDAAPSNLANMAFGASAEAETATGNVDLVFTASANANNGLYSWGDLTMVAYAWRIT